MNPVGKKYIESNIRKNYKLLELAEGECRFIEEKGSRNAIFVKKMLAEH